WLSAGPIVEVRQCSLSNSGGVARVVPHSALGCDAVGRPSPGPPAQTPAWPADAPDPATSQAPWHVYNIGNSNPVEVTEVVRLIEQAIGKPARRELLPMQPGDVAQTYADAADLERAVGFRPKTPIEEGIRRFVDWFLGFGPK